ncbi:crotonobetainyl-CoA:carnitine CoA-transferase CaiB-like acyl-CoA transferase [Arthrobacter stackebrandtii]|uniref:Crotonobetainyl-CoA:carnitine CoA-transferase CaiB-like acyl-CoA transferase n=1 Tax=Arthrobacter stackebrandtii TaxID=272161 RepID=A0ABS4YRL5_9MICC|nr:CoA transferase [Arthrobacter stackebrandtii]MBP2411431.1 crotonobetainyl-CoA:carnitine CoA-transferase CaiB-like acyl-CoA transferase [Arthrobacter stackebrandtii]PYH00284.1 acyl-CoA transferase [Arthrobacter stackebrandtii]
MDVNHGKFDPPRGVHTTGSGTLPSAFDVSGLAVAAIAGAASAIDRLARFHGAAPSTVTVDRDLASLWFGMSFTPDGWELPSPWDAIAGDYACTDGWIRLHTNAPHHRAAALKVLGLGAGANRETVASAVAPWNGEELEAAVVAAGGCAAVMRSRAQWLAHPQGRAVAGEPLVAWGVARSPDDGGRRRHSRPAGAPPGNARRPLEGVRVLDLTRVIAGPVATRFLAAYGAQVLRIDPPDWEETAVEAELTVGKHCARLDLKMPGGLARLHELLAGADVFIHGYRPDALDRLGLSDEVLAERHPSLVNVALDAYGWSGPWAQRRGFDSLVQMSCGIAGAGMAHFGSAVPHPLPVQALDHATGYLCAAAALDAWRGRLDGTVRNARLSLARTAVELMGSGPSDPAAPLPALDPAALVSESTAWGSGRRLPWPVAIPGVVPRFDVPALGFGSAPAAWD